MTIRAHNSDDPLAYFITWTTYGTWLPGDERGWHRWGEGEQRPSQLLVDIAETSLKEPAFLLRREDCNLVETTIKRHCELRGWQLHAVNARSNHVHVVVTAGGRSPNVVRDQFKSWCTRKLQSTYPDRDRFWTEGASCRWINHDDDLEAAIVYTIQAQDRKERDHEKNY